jgi:hypothetical protein
MTDKKPVLPGVGSAFMANQSPNVGKAVPFSQITNLQTVTAEVAEEVKDSVATEEKPKEDADTSMTEIDKPLLPAEPMPVIPDNRFGNPFFTEAERKAVEDTLAPINFEDLIFKGYIEQGVNIRPQLRVIFQTIDAETVTYMERDLYTLKGSDKYVLDTFALLNLAASLVSINDKPLPPYRNPDGVLLEDKFKDRVKVVMKLPVVVFDLLVIHANWFNERVQKACSIEKLKN